MDRSGCRSAGRRYPVGLALVLGVSLWLHMGPHAAGQARPPGSSRQDPAGTAVDTKRLESKLDQILDNQERIFQRLDEVMAELNIVKIRATLRRP